MEDLFPAIVNLIFRKQNKFQIRKKAGIQSQENGRFYIFRMMYTISKFQCFISVNWDVPNGSL